MKIFSNAVFVLCTVWIGSYIYMWSLYPEPNYFVPSFTAILAGFALKISPRKGAKSFFASLRFGRAFVSILIPGLIAFFGGSASGPNWVVLPPLFGMFLLTSALVDRMDAKHRGA